MEEVKTTEVPKPEQEEKKQVDQKAEDAKTKCNTLLNFYSLNSLAHKGRLIIRNLVYDINEKHLRNLFKPFGEIQGVYFLRISV